MCSEGVFQGFFHICEYVHKENQVFIEEIFVSIYQQIQILILDDSMMLHF